MQEMDDGSNYTVRSLSCNCKDQMNLLARMKVSRFYRDHLYCRMNATIRDFTTLAPALESSVVNE